jgi:multicomponent Na+:H+ antiporter subunit D
MLYVFGTDTMADLNLGLPTAWFVSITIIVASLIALGKDDLKARLAFSTVSQLAYIVLGVALLTPYGIAGGLIHIANHAFAKITLFFCAGAIYVVARRKKISEMGGLGRVMPWTFAAFAIASLSMIGVPGVAGFISKWHLLLGAWDAGSMTVILILLTSTVLNAAYFGPIVYQGFFGERPADSPDTPVGDASALIVVPLMITALLSVAIGIFPGFFMQFVHLVLP